MKRTGNIIDRYLVGLLSCFLVATGCGDDSTKGQESNNSGDKSSEKGDQTIAELSVHCPGEVNEKKDIYYCVVPAGEYTIDQAEDEEQLHWTEDLIYVLDGKVFIGDDNEETVLTIDPGTLILGETVTDLDNSAALIIQRSSKVMAEGTPEKPIVFTSAKEIGKRANDDWGGVVINGKAPINRCNGETNCSAAGEGDTGRYGGNDPDDDSGVLNYVRIEFSGKRLDPTKEFNGLSLQGVGRGTDIHHIQIHRAGDDTIEFFGGTAEVHHILLSGTGDDSFDWTDGWSGKAQFVIAIGADGLASDCAIEADNLELDFDTSPRSNPTLYNFSLLTGGEMLFRRGTAGTFVNFATYSELCLDVADISTWEQIEADNLTITHSVVDHDNCFRNDDLEHIGNLESDWWAAGENNRIISDFGLVDPFAEKGAAPDFRLKDDSPLWDEAGAPPEGDDFFETVEFIGAMGADDWTEGWTDYPEN